MTNEEAVKVANVLKDVDGGCDVCAAYAAEDLAKVFPEHPWLDLVKVLAALQRFDDGLSPGPRPGLPDGYSIPAGLSL